MLCLRPSREFELGLRAHLRAPLGAMPFVIVEPFDGLVGLPEALGVIGPDRFGDVMHVIRPQEEVSGEDMPPEQIHHLGLAIGRRRAGRGDFLKVEDDDPRRPEIELRRLVQRRIFADRIVDIALEHGRDRFRRRLDLELSKHVLDLFGAGRRDQVLEHRHGVPLRDLGQTELLDFAEAPSRRPARSRPRPRA